MSLVARDAYKASGALQIGVTSHRAEGLKAEPHSAHASPRSVNRRAVTLATGRGRLLPHQAAANTGLSVYRSMATDPSQLDATV